MRGDLALVDSNILLTGKTSHDANLIALMHEHNVPLLITLNPADFAGYSEIQLFSPDSFLEAL